MQITDVRVKDVVDAFPLTYQESPYRYMIRFQTVLHVSATKKMVAWMDLDNELDI